MMKHFPLRFGIVILLISVLCGCELKPGKNNSDTNKQQEGNHVTIPDDNKIPDNHKTPESGKAEAEESELAVLQQQIAENGYGAGVSFLGYVDSELHMTELSNYLEAGLFMEKYPFLMDADCFMTEGQELYAIVPPNKKGQMSLMYIGNTDEIDGGSCMLFELGTDGEYQFVREQLYGVCDNRIYAYDVIGDAWNIIY